MSAFKKILILGEIADEGWQNFTIWLSEGCL